VFIDPFPTGPDDPRLPLPIEEEARLLCRLASAFHRFTLAFVTGAMTTEDLTPEALAYVRDMGRYLEAFRQHLGVELEELLRSIDRPPGEPGGRQGGD
jgi:hypothetical protein